MDTFIQSREGRVAAVLLAVFLALLSVEKVFEIRDAFKPRVGEKTNTITISAEGKVTGRPDVGVVQLSVVTEGADPKDIQSKNSEKVNSINSFLKSQGVKEEDITTSQFNLNPQYDYRDVPPRIVNYSVTQTLSAKVRNIEKIGGIIEGATSRGANQITGVQFMIDNPDDLKGEARKKALENAKKKAEELAEVAGVRIGRVVTFTEGDIFTPPVPYFGGPVLDGRGGGGGTVPEIERGTQEVVVNVTVTFEIR